MLCRVILLILLLILAIEDILIKKLSLILICLVALVGLFGFQGMVVILGIIPGAILVIFSRLSRGSIGLGDGLLICAIGLDTGFMGCMYMLCYSLFLSGIAGGIMLCLGKSGKEEIAFAPYVCMGYAVWLVTNV